MGHSSSSSLSRAAQNRRARHDYHITETLEAGLALIVTLFAFTDAEQIRKVIKFESESHLPASNIDDVIVGFYKVSEQGPRSRVLIFAVEKATIKRHLEALGKVGIEPTQIDLSATGLFGLAQLLPDIGSDDPEDTTVNVILDLGDLTTTVMVTATAAMSGSGSSSSSESWASTWSSPWCCAPMTTMSSTATAPSAGPPCSA